jgi:multiple sugar transport system substrate-binding protein
MIVGVAVLAVLPFTCSRKPPDGQIALKIWAGGKPDETAMFEEALALFEEKHPGITAKLEVPTGGRVDKYLAAMQAGSCADVLWIHWRDTPPLAAKSALVPLDPLCARDGYDLDDFYAGGVNAYKYDDRLYAMPHKGSTLVVFYNKDIFDKAGMAYPTDDWTREDFLEVARKLTVVDERGRLLQVGCLPYSPYSWVWSNGGRFSSDDMSETFFTDPKTIEALQFYESLRNKWKVATRNMDVSGRDPAAIDAFEKGNVALDISGPWRLPEYIAADTFDWDVALYPKGPAGRQTRYAGMGLAIWSGSLNKDEAWELVKFLCGRDGGRVFAKGFLDIPSRRSLAVEVFAKQEAPFDMDVLLRSMDEPTHTRIRVFPRSEKWAHLDRLFKEQLEAALVQDKTVEEAMRVMQDRADRFLADEKLRARMAGYAVGPADYLGLAALLLGAVGLSAWRIRVAGRADS